MKIDLSSIMEMIAEQDGETIENKNPPVVENKLQIEQLFKLFEELEPSLNEMAKEREKIDISWDGIPDVPMSEIAFGGKGEDIISQEKKERLKVFLKNIEGSSFEEKLQNLSKFLNGDLIHEDPSIEKALSYLVLLKIFTSNLTDFNEKSAGTNFEAIFASLMGGEQVSGGEADFKDTADAIVNGKRYSLKMVQENTPWGNSKSILINTLAISPKKEIEFIIAYKKPGRQGLRIRFFSYPINMNNIFDVLTGHGNTMRLVRNPSETVPDRELSPGEKVYKSILKIAEENDYVRAYVRAPRVKHKNHSNIFYLSETLSSDKKSDKLKIIDITNYFYEFETYGDLRIEMRGPSEQRKIQDFEKRMENPSEFDLDAVSLKKAYEEAVKFFDQFQELKNSSSINERLGQEIVITKQQFNNIGSDEEKIKYLKASSYAYAAGDKFDIGPNNPDLKQLSEIIFGPQTIEKVYQTYKQKLDNSIFEIFRELKIMSINLEAFFSGGMKDLEQAQRAQQASNTINEMTKEYTKPKQ